MLKIDDEMLWAVEWLTKGFCTSSLAARPMFVSPEKESPKSTDAGNLTDIKKQCVTLIYQSYNRTN